MRIYRTLIKCCVLVMTSASSSYADELAIGRGEILVGQHCVRCHAIDSSEASRFPPAPPLGTIVQRYPAEHLAEAFAEGISVGHDAMPEFVFPPNEVGDLILYLDSLSNRASQ